MSNPDACAKDGVLHTEVLAFHYCCRKDKIRKMRQMLKWDETNSWPAVTPDWISLHHDNEGGGGPCAPTYFKVLVHYPPYSINPMCCKRKK